MGTRRLSISPAWSSAHGWAAVTRASPELSPPPPPPLSGVGRRSTRRRPPAVCSSRVCSSRALPSTRPYGPITPLIRTSTRCDSGSSTSRCSPAPGTSTRPSFCTIRCSLDASAAMLSTSSAGGSPRQVLIPASIRAASIRVPIKTTCTARLKTRPASSRPFAHGERSTRLPLRWNTYGVRNPRNRTTPLARITSVGSNCRNS
mmetsp:Transcript_13374/g.44057  ORF Transcript_13374/g.44057 Transcript_13374/m.44057 type:complete len:203 (-) Transcript_13374:48-656(-)